MSLTYIGPLALDAHYDPEFAWSGDPLGAVVGRGTRISGLLEWDEAKTLQELVTNPHRRIAVGETVGVLEAIWNSDELLRDFNGWYLFQSVSIDANQIDSVSGVVPFSLAAVNLGDRRLVVTRSARLRDDAFTVTAKSLLVQPLWNDINGGDAFDMDPGGTSFEREYDPRTAYFAGAGATTGRNLRLHEGSLT